MNPPQNAKIISTMLGIENHDILSFYLYLDYGDSGQDAGGYALDAWNPTKEKRIGAPKSMELIRQIIELVGVEKWEDLPGKHIRVRADNSQVYEIGHYLNDRWLNFTTFFRDTK